LSSWSFISRIQNVLLEIWASGEGWETASLTREKPQVLGLEGALAPGPRCTNRLQSTGARTQLHPPTLGGMAQR